MAYIEEISPANLHAFDAFIPQILKQEALIDEGYRFYGISEGNEAAGCIIFVEKADTAEIKYLYIQPYLRGTGAMDQMLMELFFELKSMDFKYIKVRYIPEEFAGFVHISKRFGFTETREDMAYFRFSAEDIKKCRASSYEPKGIIRLKYLPDDKRQTLYKIIDRNMAFMDYDISSKDEILPYSMAYLEREEPKGALVVEAPKASLIPAGDDKKKYPEPGAFDLALFFVGTTTLKAPLYLLSGLCRIIDKEMHDNAVMTGYFPEGHVTRLLEGTLGIKGRHEVCAVLALDEL